MTHAGELSSWEKGKDALLIGAAAIAVFAVLTILAKVTNIEVQLSAYQADARAEKESRQKLEVAVEQHFKEDRERFLKTERGLVVR